MSRLADITGLDRLGVPVWQAVRPWSRSVSVHQGKGFSALHARLGACMEAIECAHAESWSGETWLQRHDALPPGERSDAADDFARARGGAIAEPIGWTPLDRIGGGRLWVPAASVSLDMSRPRPLWVERSSSGQGAGFDLPFASLKGLCELIERDAFQCWTSRSIMRRSQDAIDPASVPYDWFGDLVGRFGQDRVWVRLFALPAVVALPVFLAQIFDPGTEAANHPLATGLCGHVDPESALKGAIAEAAQSRLAKIAGARDDLELAEPELLSHGAGMALPLPRGHPRRTFEPRLEPPPAPQQAFDGLVEALARTGYPIVGRVQLSPADCPVTSVKLFVPGLAAFGRARRSPHA